MTRVSEHEQKNYEYAGQLSIGIVVSRFNSAITDKLLKAATDTLLERGVSREKILTVDVPGSFEIPLISKKIAESGNFDAVIAIGTIIRGATYHFELICQACAQGLVEASLQSGVPIIFGVLTTDSLEQALERAGGREGNKGSEAALSALDMAHSIKRLQALNRNISQA